MMTKKIIATGLLALPFLLTACNDPCLDDGFVKGQCERTKNEGGEANGGDANGDSAGDSAGGDSAGDSAGKSGNDGSGKDGDNSKDKSGDKWCKDADNDGFGDPNNCMDAKPGASGWVNNGDDCDDNDANAHPGAAENEKDASACMKDADKDGFGDNAPKNSKVTPGTDCDDNDGKAFPGAASKEANGDACAKDGDGDGWGDPSPDNKNVTPGTDCDDTEANTFPGAAPNDSKTACMKDVDDDDWADNNPPTGKDGKIEAGTDCDDENAKTHVGAAENELKNECTKDSDNDGWADNDPGQDDIKAGSDCDDLEPETFPGAAEKETGDLAKACTKDVDKDGWADDSPSQDDIAKGNDCDDSNPNIHPGAAEKEHPGKCTKDNDMDGWADSDDHGNKGLTPGSDCDDEDPNSDVDCDESTPLSIKLKKNYNIKAGESVVLEASAKGGSKKYEWKWEPPKGLSATDVAQPKAKPEATATYKVTVTDTKTKESKSATVTVHVTDKPVKLGECLDKGIIEIGGFKFDLSSDTQMVIQESKWTWNKPNLCQTENNQPGAVLCRDWMLDNAVAIGDISADGDATKNLGSKDDDWIGLIWGAQETGKQYYLMSWKGGYQSNHNGCTDDTGSFDAGIYIRRFDESKGKPLGCYPMVGTINDAEATYKILAKPENFKVIKGGINFAKDGWKQGEVYHYELTHAGKESTVRIFNNDRSQGVEVKVVDEDPFARGYWGSFSMSQDNACFANVYTKGL